MKKIFFSLMLIMLSFLAFSQKSKINYTLVVRQDTVYQDSVAPDTANLAKSFNEDDYYDYQYSSRLRRFQDPFYLDNYYSDYYTNMYWYNHNFLDWGTSIYMGYNFWNPYYRWNYYGLDYGWNYIWNYPYYSPYYSYPYFGWYGGGWNNWNHHYNNNWNYTNNYYGHRNGGSAESMFGRRFKNKNVGGAPETRFNNNVIEKRREFSQRPSTRKYEYDRNQNHRGNDNPANYRSPSPLRNDPRNDVYVAPKYRNGGGLFTGGLRNERNSEPQRENRNIQQTQRERNNTYVAPQRQSIPERNVERNNYVAPQRNNTYIAPRQSTPERNSSPNYRSEPRNNSYSQPRSNPSYSQPRSNPSPSPSRSSEGGGRSRR